MHHPRNKAERRRVKYQKDRLDKRRQDHEDAVQRRLAEEALEQKEALDVLRKQVPDPD